MAPPAQPAPGIIVTPGPMTILGEPLPDEAALAVVQNRLREIAAMGNLSSPVAAAASELAKAKRHRIDENKRLEEAESQARQTLREKQQHAAAIEAEAARLTEDERLLTKRIGEQRRAAAAPRPVKKAAAALDDRRAE